MCLFAHGYYCNSLCSTEYLQAFGLSLISSLGDFGSINLWTSKDLLNISKQIVSKFSSNHLASAWQKNTVRYLSNISLKN